MYVIRVEFDGVFSTFGPFCKREANKTYNHVCSVLYEAQKDKHFCVETIRVTPLPDTDGELLDLIEEGAEL